MFTFKSLVTTVGLVVLNSSFYMKVGTARKLTKRRKVLQNWSKNKS